jgi:hypothetical protein
MKKNFLFFFLLTISIISYADSPIKDANPSEDEAVSLADKWQNNLERLIINNCPTNLSASCIEGSSIINQYVKGQCIGKDEAFRKKCLEINNLIVDNVLDENNERGELIRKIIEDKRIALHIPRDADENLTIKNFSENTQFETQAFEAYKNKDKIKSTDNAAENLFKEREGVKNWLIDLMSFVVIIFSMVICTLNIFRSKNLNAKVK